jgi:hypothetical protein
MICLRELKRGVPEKRRSTICGAPCAERPTACANLEWWSARFGICPACWARWVDALETIVSLPGDVGTER